MLGTARMWQHAVTGGWSTAGMSGHDTEGFCGGMQKPFVSDWFPPFLSARLAFKAGLDRALGDMA